MNQIDVHKMSTEELRKEVEALRRALISHGEIIEMNAKLRKEIESFVDEVDLDDFQGFSDIKK